MLDKYFLFCYDLLIYFKAIKRGCYNAAFGVQLFFLLLLLPGSFFKAGLFVVRRTKTLMSKKRQGRQPIPVAGLFILA